MSAIADLVHKCADAGVPVTVPDAPEELEGPGVRPHEQPSLKYPEGVPRWSNVAIAHFIARRSGVDFVANDTSAASLAKSCVSVRVSVLHGPALRVSTYKEANNLVDNVGFELVLIDPPFGQNKHGRRESWDTPQNKWQPSADVLGCLSSVKLRPVFCLAIYVLYQDVGAWIEALAEGTASTGTPRGQVLISLGRDGPTQYLSGTSSPGSRAYLLVLKFGDGGEAIKAEMSRLGGRFLYSFPPPLVDSKYGRTDVDAQLREDGAAVNPTQKSVEETRLLVRTLAPQGGAVLSLCNGTGTALVAAAMEGRMAVGVDDSRRQCEFTAKRLKAFARREQLARRVVEGGFDAKSSAFRQLQRAAEGVAEDEVGVL